eukprot:scaffold23168_cov125-Isochrysis_galbana.AAC.2
MKMLGEPRTAGDSTWTSGGAEHSAAVRRDDMTGQRGARGHGDMRRNPGPSRAQRWTGAHRC